MVQRQLPLPGGAPPLPPGVTALSLALADEGAALLHLPIVEQGQPRQGPLQPAGALPPGTAAWGSFAAGATLLWRRGEGEPPYSDWQELLAGAAPRAAALVTVPIAAPGGRDALGAATFALEAEPTGEEVQALRELGACLARTIMHQTKCMWEVGGSGEGAAACACVRGCACLCQVRHVPLPSAAMRSQ